jgi:DNA repair protein RadA/Sms
MKLSYNNNKLVKVSDINIPKKFFTRMKTEVHELDNLFGDGILPGLTFTVTAAPGTGKTTFLLQLLDNLANKGYSVGYFTGEEDIRQVAFTCKRLGVTEVSICNETNIDTICDMTKDLDIIVIDSFPCITLKGTYNKNAKEKLIVEKIIKAAEDNECAIGIILHITKAGTYKGGTLIPHAVGANFMLEANDEYTRTISSSKNRY